MRKKKKEDKEKGNSTIQKDVGTACTFRLLLQPPQRPVARSFLKSKSVCYPISEEESACRTHVLRKPRRPRRPNHAYGVAVCRLWKVIHDTVGKGGSICMLGAGFAIDNEEKCTGMFWLS